MSERGKECQLPEGWKPTAESEISDVREMKVLRVQYLRGSGTPEDVMRTVNEYWSHEGKLLAVTDPIKNGVAPEIEH